MRRRRLLGLALSAVLPPVPTWSHSMPSSTAVAQLEAGGVHLVVYLPISELKAATDDGPAANAGEYVLRHVDVVGADGRIWRKQATGAEADTRDGVAVMVVSLAFKPHPDGNPRAARLRYDAVNHRIASHYVLVYRREGDTLVPLARLQSPTTELQLP